MPQGPRICVECGVFADLMDALELRDSWQCPRCGDRTHLTRFQDISEQDVKSYSENTKVLKFLIGRDQ